MHDTLAGKMGPRGKKKWGSYFVSLFGGKKIGASQVGIEDERDAVTWLFKSIHLLRWWFLAKAAAVASTVAS